MKIALIYDRVNKIGGAERVLAALHELWPNAPLYTSLYYPKGAPWAKDLTVVPSFINRIPGANRHHELLPTLMPYAFESFDLSGFDLVISVTSAEAKGVITRPGQLHICYLLTPTRYLWSHFDRYAGNGIIGRIRRPFMDRLRQWDAVAASRPDRIVCISEAVAARCVRYYRRTPDAVIYPPVNTRYFSRHPDGCSHPEPGYYLIVSRLVPYKNVDLAVKTCTKLHERLVVVGTGSETTRLRSLAGPTVSFTGQVPDATLACLYHHAKGLLFPQEEEFGITALEAQAAGIPVVAYDGGAAPEIIAPGKTGILFSTQSVTGLSEAMAALKNHTWYDRTIQDHAHQFETRVFHNRFKQFVEEAWQTHQYRG